MKVFISWSGETSHQVAKVFRDWLPSVIQSVAPYVSSEDIDKGSRWSTDIASELEESSYGILCVTKENLEAPWLNFEAGALGKSVEKSRVSPFLHKLKRSEVKGPILQYQSTIQDKEDVHKLVKSINDACGDTGLDEARLEKVFNVWWPDLEKELNEIETPILEEPERTQSNPIPELNGLSEILEEVLEISRTNQKLLRDPEEILPPKYLEYVIERSSQSKTSRIQNERYSIHPDAIEEAILVYRDLSSYIRNNEEQEKDLDSSELVELIQRLDRPMRHIRQNFRGLQREVKF